MNPDWAHIRLGDVCTKIGSGATPTGGSQVYLQTGPFALIRSQNIHPDGFRHENLAFISEEQAAALANVAVEQGDILLNITGDSVARVCEVDPAVLPARVNQHVAIIRTKRDLLDPLFLRYVLASPNFQARLLSLAASGGTRSALTKQMLEGLQISAPTSLEEQRAIGDFFSTLDAKSRINRAMNEVLDELLTTDLERRIACDWREVTFSELMTLERTLIDPTRAPDEEFDHYSLPAYDQSRVPEVQLGSEISSAKLAVVDDCVLVSKLNPRINRVWFPLPTRSARRRIASTEFMVVTPKNGATTAFLYALWRSRGSRQALVARVTGTSGSHQRVRPADVLSSVVRVPSPAGISEFDALAQPLHARYIANLLETERLEALRDALLPQVTSGARRIR